MPKPPIGDNFNIDMQYSCCMVNVRVSLGNDGSRRGGCLGDALAGALGPKVVRARRKSRGQAGRAKPT